MFVSVTSRDRDRMPSSPRRMRSGLRTAKCILSRNILLAVYFFICLPTLKAQHEAEFVCPNPDIHYDCKRTTDRSKEIIGDEQTLLDMFGEAAKEFLTQRVIPPTNSDCRWDWRHARCEPFCDCSFQPRWGDFHLGRSCRQRKRFQTVDGKTKEIWWNGQEMCHIEPDTPYTKFSSYVIDAVRSGGKKLKLGMARVAERFTIKSRFGRARGDTCMAWKERAEAEGRELNDFQRKICPEKDVGSRVKSSNPDAEDELPTTDDMTKSASTTEASDSVETEMNAEQNMVTRSEAQNSEQTDDKADMKEEVAADEGGKLNAVTDDIED